METPDDLIHQPVRLKIMAALNTLASNQWLEFVSLRAIVDTTDGNLGAHLGTLEGAEYVRIKKDSSTSTRNPALSEHAHGHAPFYKNKNT